jgi:uncharacterized protein (TIGR02302 family)
MPDLRNLFRAFLAGLRADAAVLPTPSGSENNAAPKAPTLLDRLLFRSSQALVVERLLRLGAALATLTLFFVALSWLDLWRPAPVEARMAGVGLFGFLALFLIVREIARGWPSRASALQRLDAAATAPLRPARSLDDTLAAQRDDPATRALWEVHRRRLEAALAQTPIATPKPDLARRDPFALRALALVAAVAAGFIAGDEKSARLAAAFDWRAGDRLLGPSERIDAWFEPPAYTGRPAIVLGSESGVFEAPQGSLLRLRPETTHVSVDGGLTLAPPETTGTADVAATGAQPMPAYRLIGPAALVLADGRRFEVTAIPDLPPGAALTAKPRNNAHGSMTLAYEATDDYGVVAVEAVFDKKPGDRRALYAPPRMPLSPPTAPGGSGAGKTTLDLAENPYAGTPVTLRVVAKDGAGQEGASSPVEVVLPQRRFKKPLARALVEQRRILALDPENRAVVRQAIEALALAPEAFETPSAVFLGLRAVHVGLQGPRSDDDLRGVVDTLWALALTVENDGAPQAENDLRAAEQALREAIARGDSEEEIAQKTEELRAALDKMLEQMGARPDPNRPPSRSASGDSDTVTPEDLQSMLDDIDKAMKSGDVAQAQQLLDELQDIMENLQTAESGAAGSQRQQGAKALKQLDDLAREEQRLRDETFQGETGMRERQKALRDRLESRQKDMEGADPEAEGDLDAARRAMKEAEEALGPKGEGREAAVEAQGRAVESLRKGADRLAEKMRGEGEGEDGQPSGRRRTGKGQDPLGRNSGGKQARGKYDPLGLPPAQRAHRVQEELRRRLGQPERPPQELDYLERLLRR